MGADGSKQSSTNVSNAASQSFGSSFNLGSSQGGSFIDPTQQPFRSNLFSQAFGMGDAGAQAELTGQAAGQNQAALSAGLQNLTAQMNPQAQIAAQTKALSSGLGAMFRDEINPTLEGNAIMAGGFGGGRQGVAQGVATGKLGEAFTQGLGDIMARANQQSLSASSQIPGLAQANLGNAGAAQNAGLGILERLGGILGNPAILSQQSSQSTGGSVNKSQSLAKSSGSSKSGSFGFKWF